MGDDATRIRRRPCGACPYKRSSPSGIWALDEYAKLLPYDRETMYQPMAAFACHATPKYVCHGWAVVHSNRGHEYELLALRLLAIRGLDVRVPDPTVPLFTSARETFANGIRGLRNPSRRARRFIDAFRRANKRPDGRSSEHHE